MPTTLLPKASSAARAFQDDVQIWLHVFMIVILVIMTLVIFGFAWKYRKTDENPKATSNLTHSLTLEWVWTVIPTLVFFYLFYLGVIGYTEDLLASDGVKYQEVDVEAKKWSWTFRYPGTNIVTNELYLEAGQKYKMNLWADKKDVLHSFYMRSAGVKADVIPGRYNYVVFDTSLDTFDANELAIGYKTVDIFCTEYCGDDHSSMLTNVYIMLPEVYKKWYDGQLKRLEFLKTASPAERGEALFVSNGCNACHSVDGTAKGYAGPTLKGKWGKPEKIEGGSDVMVDENYVVESILYPAKKIVAGYPNGMLSFEGKLKDKEIKDLIAYIRSLK